MPVVTTPYTKLPTSDVSRFLSLSHQRLGAVTVILLSSCIVTWHESKPAMGRENSGPCFQGEFLGHGAACGKNLCPSVERNDHISCPAGITAFSLIRTA